MTDPAAPTWLARLQRLELALPAGLALLALAVALGLGQWRAWLSLNDPEPLLAGLPGAGSRQLDVPPPRVCRRIVLIIADGLRADAAGQLPSLVQLARRGVHAELTAAGPTFSTPSHATWLSGLDPTDSGVRTNRYRWVLPLDSLLSRARAARLRTLAFDEGPPPHRALLDRLFAPHLSVRVFGAERWPEVFTQLPTTDLAVLALTAPDIAAHRHGARGPEYLEAAAATGRRVEQLLRAVDLAQDLVVVVNDHGHLPRGGHGGLEAEVRRLFIIAAGAGIVESRGKALSGDADQRDLAVTLALLLGLPPPAHARGWLLGWALSPELEPRFHRAALASLLSSRLRVERYLASELGAEQRRSTRPEDIVRASLGDTSEAWRLAWHLVGSLQERVNAARRSYLHALRVRAGTTWGIGAGVVLVLLVVAGRLRMLRVGVVGAILALVPPAGTGALLYALQVQPSLSIGGPLQDLGLRLLAAAGGASLVHMLAVLLPSRKSGDRITGRVLAGCWLAAIAGGAAFALIPVAAGAALPDLRLLAGCHLALACATVMLACEGMMLSLAGLVRRVRRSRRRPPGFDALDLSSPKPVA